MKCYISAKNNAEVIVLPYLSADPEITSEQKNEEIGDFVAIGETALKKINIESFLPIKQMRQMAKGSVADPFFYTKWIDRLRGEKIPLRMIIIDDSEKEIFNYPILINSYTATPIKSGYYLTLECTEFRFGNARAL